jgi:hypothetical protein
LGSAFGCGFDSGSSLGGATGGDVCDASSLCADASGYGYDAGAASPVQTLTGGEARHQSINFAFNFETGELDGLKLKV